MKRLYLQMHITNKCGNRCLHCYQTDYGGKDMTANEAELVLTEHSNICKRLDISSKVAITGGDPLASTYFKQIVASAGKLCNKVEVLGNPELLTDDLARFIKEQNVRTFQLSLDGTEKTHDFIRGQGSFIRTCNAVKTLATHGIRVRVNMTASDLNRHEAANVERIALSHGAVRFNIEEEVPQGKDCPGKINCGIGCSVLTILPDLTLMACRRVPSSILGAWSNEKGIEYHFVHSPKMKQYRAMRNNAINGERG